MSDEKTSYGSIVDYVESKFTSIYVNEFTEASAKKFYEELNAAQCSGQTIIPVYIDSYGGAVDSLAVMMDLIESSEVPVATIAIGKAMSCGSMLLTCGAEGKRYIAPQARVMIHHISNMIYDKLPEIKVRVEEMERLQQVVFSKMAKNCQKSNNYFLDILKEKGNVDWYLDAKECYKHNIVNHIKIPKFTTDVIIKNELV
jgi:ATP-dependent Clp protease protease subunit